MVITMPRDGVPVVSAGSWLRVASGGVASVSGSFSQDEKRTVMTVRNNRKTLPRKVRDLGDRAGVLLPRQLLLFTLSDEIGGGSNLLNINELQRFSRLFVIVVVIGLLSLSLLLIAKIGIKNEMTKHFDEKMVLGCARELHTGAHGDSPPVHSCYNFSIFLQYLV